MGEPLRKPERTCLGCRETYPQSDLLRYVLSPDGKLCPDYRAKLPGRGAYTCFNLECIKNALRQNRFERAFRRTLPQSGVADLLLQIKHQIYLRILSLLGIARKSGATVTGSGAVGAMLDGLDVPALILLAVDISEGIASKIIHKAEKKKVPVYSFFDKGTMGQLVGKGERSVVALKASGVADAIKAELLKYKDYVGEN